MPKELLDQGWIEYEVDPLLCPCGGKLKVISLILRQAGDGRIQSPPDFEAPSCSLA